MADPKAITLNALGEVTADGQGAGVELDVLHRAAKVELEIAEAAGEITVTIETAPEAAGPWRRGLEFDPLAQPGTYELCVDGLSRWVRATWVTSATVTFAVAGSAHVLYADVREISLPGAAIRNLERSALVKAAIDATGEAETYLASAYTLPLVAWPDELRRKIGHLMAYEVMRIRGFQPQGPDEILLLDRDKAITWLNRIANGGLRPPGIVDSTPEEYEPGAVVVSRPRRGW
jgi:phage gp36-like protein